ncbi:unnamed protein product [Staurois parvus]|uniref:Uncharacterized protein n=1 Tax=Staurois parvus TaxID=386267 RepID=A0ABN9H068_9NEOB|nr:unnamed protein product [Staurois parvus]
MRLFFTFAAAPEHTAHQLSGRQAAALYTCSSSVCRAPAGKHWLSGM